MTTYACHNRAPYRADVTVQAGWHEQTLTSPRMPRMTTVPFRMARDCQYTNSALGQSDERCAGCQHRSTTTPPAP